MAAPTDFKIEVRSEPRMYDLFYSINARFDKNIRESLKDIGANIASNMQYQFEEGGIRGKQSLWEIRKNPTPLVDTHGLKNSIEGEVHDRGENFVVVVGTDKSYAETMDKGGTVMTDIRWLPPKNYGTKSNWVSMGKPRKVTIPPRPFMFVSDDELDMATDVVEITTDEIMAIEGLV